MKVLANVQEDDPTVDYFEGEIDAAVEAMVALV